MNGDRELPLSVRPLSLRQLEVFHAVMVTGSLSAAGRMLFVSQPAVSRALAACENRLGYALFERAGGKLIPTPEARRLFIETDEIYLKLRNFNELATELGRAGADLVRIASNSGPGAYLIPQAIIAVRETSPARFQFTPMNSSQVVNHVLLGRADIGISLFPVSHPNLTLGEIGHGNLVCVVPKGQGLRPGLILRPADVLAMGRPLIGYAPHSQLGQVVASFFRMGGCEAVPDVEVSSPVIACNMVREGVGVSLVDSLCITPGLLRDVAVLPLEPAMPLKVLALRAKTESLSAAGKAFLRCLRRVLAEHQHAPLK